MQCAFIDALVHPVFKLLSELLPLVDQFCIVTLNSNRAFWNSMLNQEITTSAGIIGYLKEVREPSNNKIKDEESEFDTENDEAVYDAIVDAIPGIPFNAPKAHSHSTRKLSMISMKDNLESLEDPELGAIMPSFRNKEIITASVEKKTFWYHNIEIFLRRRLENIFCQVILLVATIYALFAIDTNMAFGSKSADGIVDTFSLIVLLIFVVEMLVSIICVPKYPQFFLWLDLAACVSLLFEIDMLFGYGETPGDLSLAKASRAAKAGARAGR